MEQKILDPIPLITLQLKKKTPYVICFGISAQTLSLLGIKYDVVKISADLLT